MANEELNSPPYPGTGTTVALLYKYLCDLREWVLATAQEISISVDMPDDEVPELILPPKASVYAGQSLTIQWYHFVTMRRIREEWDNLIRNYEANWDCRPCLSARTMLVAMAAQMFNDAFTPQELREMNEEKASRRMKRAFERLSKNLQQLIGDPGDFDEEEEDAEDR